jgi:hypothetical protein
VRQIQWKLDIVDCETDTAEARHFSRTDIRKVLRPPKRRLDSIYIRGQNILRGQALLINRHVTARQVLDIVRPMAETRHFKDLTLYNVQ